MAKKLAKILSSAIFIGLIFSFLSFGWYYIQSYLVLKSAVGIIATTVSEEGCLANEDVYKGDSGYYSVQDYMKNYLSSLDNSNWFMEFNTYNLVGGKTSDSAVRLWWNKNGQAITADSYLNAADRGTVVNLTLRATYVITLNFAPEINGQKLTMRIPISYSLPVITNGYYKGTDDNRGF